MTTLSEDNDNSNFVRKRRTKEETEEIQRKHKENIERRMKKAQEEADWYHNVLPNLGKHSG
jgi:hypothetical protein